MRKELKTWGNSMVIVFSKEDQKVYGLKLGDIIEFTITKVKKEN